jgi:hypothetical protein
MLWWRIPVLKPYRYIVYHDSSLSVRNRHLYRDVMQHLQNNSYVHIAHPQRTTIAAEALESISQPRYLADNVDLQADHYLREWQFPDNVGLRLGGFAAYDANDTRLHVSTPSVHYI